MHGFGARTRKSEGILHDIYAKAVLLLANQPLFIVTIEALGCDRSFTSGVKSALFEACGLKENEIIINFSHTHASVFLTGEDALLRRGGYSIGQERWLESESKADYTADIAYYHDVRNRIIRMAKHCFEHAVEGTMLLGLGASDFAVSRRKPTLSGGVTWAPYYDGEIDKDLYVMKLEDKEGNLKAILYNYGCHTTCMGPANYMISGDFAGVTSARLEASYPGTVALFLQGCAAELKPIHTANGDRFEACSLEKMEQAGVDFAHDVAGVMQHAKFTKVKGPFHSRLLDIRLYTQQPRLEEYEHLANDPSVDDFRKNSAKRLLEAIEDGTVKDHLDIHVSIWELDHDTSLIAIEGEVSNDYSVLLKRLFKEKKLIVLGYTDGVISYLPSRKCIQEGGYEAENNYFFNLRGPFIPEIEDIIIGQIVKAM